MGLRAQPPHSCSPLHHVTNVDNTGSAGNAAANRNQHSPHGGIGTDVHGFLDGDISDIFNAIHGAPRPVNQANVKPSNIQSTAKVQPPKVQANNVPKTAGSATTGKALINDQQILLGEEKDWPQGWNFVIFEDPVPAEAQCKATITDIEDGIGNLHHILSDRLRITDVPVTLSTPILGTVAEEPELDDYKENVNPQEKMINGKAGLETVVGSGGRRVVLGELVVDILVNVDK
ncbi:hypothetical protein RUND412_009459 [Rhizina undulata]